MSMTTATATSTDKKRKVKFNKSDFCVAFATRQNEIKDTHVIRVYMAVDRDRARDRERDDGRE